jgi:hypothetical protein
MIASGISNASSGGGNQQIGNGQIANGGRDGRYQR